MSAQTQKRRGIVSLFARLYSVRYMLKPEQWQNGCPESRELYDNMLRLAWPSALESILISLIGSIDTMMVSALGTAAIAAVGLTNQPKFILLAIIFSLNTAITAIVARRKGQGDRDAANSTLRQGVMLSAGLSAILSTLGFIFAKPLMLFSGANADTLEMSVTYFRIIAISVFFSAVCMTINAAQRGAGNTRISMKTNILSNVVNVIFNFLLIEGRLGFPRLEVTGAALATLFGSIAGLILAIISVVGEQKFLHIDFHSKWSFDKGTVQNILKIGGSAMVEQVFMRIGFFAYSRIVASLGTVAYATHQVCMNIINFSYSFGDGLTVASSSLVGQSLGAQKPDYAMAYGKIGQRLALTVSTFLSLLFIFGRSFLLSLYSNDPEVIALGGIILIVIACTTHAQTSQVVFSGCLRGAGDTKYVAMVSLISIGIIRPILTYLLCLPLGVGLLGAWIGLFIDQYIRFFCSWARFRKGKWQKIKI